MNPEMKVRVGILTEGTPRLTDTSRGLRVENALIGEGFHWQRTYPILLPREATVSVESLDGRAHLIAEMPLERYVASVVSSEMNPEAHPEFIKAHAVISRSWVAGKILSSHPDSREGACDTPHRLITWQDTADHHCHCDAEGVHGFHVCNDDHCQRYQGEDYITPRVLAAVEATRGIILRDRQGEVMDARFSKCCGGRSELFSACWQDTDFHYLQPVSDPWCDLSRITPEERDTILSTVLKDYDRTTTPHFHDWTLEVSTDDIRRNLREKFHRSVGDIINIEADTRGASGRIITLRITGTEGTLILGKELAVRRLLSPSHLLSSAFEITPLYPAPSTPIPTMTSSPSLTSDTSSPSEDIVASSITTDKAASLSALPIEFRLQGRGWGHGVGLCQIGAAVMAHRGYTARQILEHYYGPLEL